MLVELLSRGLIPGLLLCGSTQAFAQGFAPHPLGPLTVSGIRFGSISGIRVLEDGRVLVNDLGRHQVVLLDATLTHATVVMDSAVTGAVHGYGRAGGALSAYRSDSTIFFDMTSNTLVMISPGGEIVRVFAPPPGDDLSYMATQAMLGELVYDGNTGFVRPWRFFSGVLPVPIPDDSLALIGVGLRGDSTPLIHTDLFRMRRDTVAYIYKGKSYPPSSDKPFTGPGGSVPRENPFQEIDSWGLLPDGTLAIVRAHDFHVDWIAPDGARTSTPKIPFPVQHISDDEKVEILDSMQVYRWQQGEASVARQVAQRAAAGLPPLVPAQVAHPVAREVPPSEAPDYWKPFAPFGTRVDAAGNLWIESLLPVHEPLTMNDVLIQAGEESNAGSRTYDIVNRAGAIVDRIAFLPGFTIVGFGPGVVYMRIREGDGIALVRAPVR